MFTLNWNISLSSPGVGNDLATRLYPYLCNTETHNRSTLWGGWGWPSVSHLTSWCQMTCFWLCGSSAVLIIGACKRLAVHWALQALANPLLAQIHLYLTHTWDCMEGKFVWLSPKGLIGFLLIHPSNVLTDHGSPKIFPRLVFWDSCNLVLPEIEAGRLLANTTECGPSC